jgi:hypothetical protein
MFTLLEIIFKWFPVLFLVIAGPAQSTDLIVIVSSQSSMVALRAEQVADIFLAQTAQFPDGVEAVAVDLPVGATQRDEFYNKIASRSPALMKAYWTKMVFTGRGQPPRELSSSMAVRKMVADHPGTIGYIDRGALDGSVRAVLVLR